MASELILHHYNFSNSSCVHADADRFTPDFLADRAALLGKPESGLAHRRTAAHKNLTQLRPQLVRISDMLSDGLPHECDETIYGKANPSVGTLISIDAVRMALQHSNERIGLVSVHFPRFGYQVRSVAA